MKYFNELFIPIFSIDKENNEEEFLGYRICDDFINKDILVVCKIENDDGFNEFFLVENYDKVPIYLNYYNYKLYFIDMTDFHIYYIKKFLTTSYN